jgi:hypothetical protein
MQLFKTRLEIDLDEKQRLYEKIVYKHQFLLKNQYYFYSDNLNFSLNEDQYRGFTNHLTEFFINSSKEIFGDFNVNSGGRCYAYVSNTKEYHPKNRIHDHTKTCSINGVYYLNVPSSQSGMISFYDGDDREVYTYQPETFDLLIMPNFTKHYPHKSLTEEYRISINIEIFVNNWSEHYLLWHKNNFTK